MRAGDATYGKDYWDAVDGGKGYGDSVMHDDIAFILKEIFGYRDGQDIAGQVNSLEFGCGAGFLVRHMRRRGHEAWGLDISEYALNMAPEDVKTYLRWYDMTSLDGHHFGDDFCKLAVCIETMEHIPEWAVDVALFRIKHSLVAGGQVFFAICTAEYHDPWDDPTHVTIRPRAWWEHKLRAHGFIREPEIEDRVRSFYLFQQHHGVFVCRRP